MGSYLATIIGGSLVALLAGGLAYRKQRQSRTARLLAIDTPARIVEELFIRVGGIDQWIQIRGEDRRNPVLLVLHGGPGWPNATFTLPLRPWEKYFTIVQWDHRGTGKTLGQNGKPGQAEMTFARRVADAIELSEFLRQYLHQEKLVLLAESMGTLTGLPLAKQRPDLFSAIVLTDLYVNLVQNEALKYRLTLERLRTAGNARGMLALERIGSDPTQWDLQAWNVNMAWAFKTNVPIPNLDRALLFPLVLTSPLYSLRELFTLFAGFQSTTAAMFAEIMAYDARRLGSSFNLPFFLFQGERDVITLTGLAEAYFQEIEAPHKGIVLIKNAGHFAAFSHPEQFLNELLRRVVPLVRGEAAVSVQPPAVIV